MLKRLWAPDAMAGSSKKEIGERLRWARIALGYNQVRGKSQRRYALDAGIAPNAYNQCERGTNRIGVDLALALRAQHKITLDYIYCGELSNIPNEVYAYATRMRAKKAE